MVDVNALQSQNMFSKSDSSRSAWSEDQQTRNLQDEIIMHRNGGLDKSAHNESLQNVIPMLYSTQHLRQDSPSRQYFLNNQRDNRFDNEMNTLNLTKVEASTDDIMMAPQNICFIGDEEDVDESERKIEPTQSKYYSNYESVVLGQRLEESYKKDESEVGGSKVNITSGNLTYRIPSPRHAINPNTFQNPKEETNANEKGFYISFDNEQPKRPKPPLRIKRSPKKEESIDNVDHKLFVKHESFKEQSKFDSIDSKQNNLKNTNYMENNNATYNKYTDEPIQLKQLTENNNHNSLMRNTISPDRRHLEDVTNQHQPMSPILCSSAAHQQHSNEPKAKALVIGTDVSSLDPESVDEMERRKEKIMLLSLQRRQQQEESKARKEIEENRRRELEREKEEERVRKKEEQKIKRAAILEQYRLKNATVDAEREVKTLNRSESMIKQQSQSAAAPRLRQQKMIRSRPKTIHIDISDTSTISSSGKRGSTSNLTSYGGQLSSNSMRQDLYKGSQDSLNVKKSIYDYTSPKSSTTPIGQKGLYSIFREPTAERGRTLSRISVAKGSNLSFSGRKSSSLINLRETALGSGTPPRRAPSPGMSLSGRHTLSSSGPGSLPPGLITKQRGFDGSSNNISYTPNSFVEYSGPKLYKQPAAKSNRGIILNAVEYCVFPGAVNRDAKQKVLEKIARSEAQYFLVLFRDARCQFRALYSYAPESNQVLKLYGTGPSQVDEVMFDKFFKYNSGGKCFSEIYTKHLTVTMDAFTIHNSLWQGKKIHLPSKKDMALVI